MPEMLPGPLMALREKTEALQLTEAITRAAT